MSIVARIAQRLGLVRAARYAAVLQQQRKTAARCDHLSEALARARSTTAASKAHAESLANQLKETRDDARRTHGELARAQRRTQIELERSQRDLGRRLNELAAEQADNTRLRDQMATLKARLDVAERALDVARETLMAVETKLDILEGAAQVLDRRTRVDTSSAARTGAGV